MPVPKEGECHDRRGVPIYRGDLFKSLHFVGARKKRYYLYHVAVFTDGHLDMVPVEYLDPSFPDSGGRFWLTQEMAGRGEVIAGWGPGDCLDFNDRPKRIVKYPRPQRNYD